MKIDLYGTAVPLIHKTARYLTNIHNFPSQDEMDDFEKLIKLLLWSNQVNFMMSKEYVENHLSDILNIKMKDGFIVSNQLEKAWEVISDKSHGSDVIAIICNNAGFELFMELCMADYLCANYYARTIHFHVKHIPWFISDITEKDIYWMMHELSKSPDKLIQHLVRGWKDHFKAGRWKIIARKYWVLPIGFSHMRYLDPVLYKMLEDTKIIIVKGDLNYRKLLEDKNLDPSTHFSKALCGFHPSNIMMIRVIKCDIICDIDNNEVKKFEKLDKTWMDSGQYGLIQFAPKFMYNCGCTKN